MDKILDKIIRQVIVEATTRKRLTKQIDSDTILNKLIKQVITEAAQKVVISKLDNKVIALTSKYGFGFKISANYPITAAQVRGKIQTNSQVGTSSPYNSYLNYTYFVGSNMHKNPDKKFVANIVIINAKRIKLFGSAAFTAAVKNLATDQAAAKFQGINTVGQKNGALEAKHHADRDIEAEYMSSFGNENPGSKIIFIDTEPGYAKLPESLMTVLTKKGAALMSTSGSEVPGFMSADDDVAPSDSTKTDDKKVDQDPIAETDAYKSGIAKFTSNDYKGAIVDLTKAIELDPTNDKAYYMRGFAKFDLQDYSGAIADYNKAIELDPTNAKYYSMRGYSKNLLKDYKGAIADYDKAIELKPEVSIAYRMRGDSKNLLEPGTGDEDMRAFSAMVADEESQDNKLSIKKQTFTFGMTNNADLKTLQDEIKAQLKASTDQSYISSVPAFVAFMTVANMTGKYGNLTSNMIAQLKNAFKYTNTDGQTIEPDFIEIIISKTNSKLKLTEQFNFTDTEKKLISNKPVVAAKKGVAVKKGALEKAKDAVLKKDKVALKTALTDLGYGGFVTSTLVSWFNWKALGQKIGIDGEQLANIMIPNQPKPQFQDSQDSQELDAYQLCLDAAKWLRKITTTNPHDYWSGYLRWDGVEFRPNANANGIAWFTKTWNKYYGTKLAAYSRPSTMNRKNISEVNQLKNTIIYCINKQASSTGYYYINHPETGAKTEFKIIWDYFTVPQNAAVKGNPVPAAKKSSSSGAIYSNPGYGGNLGH